MEVRDRTAHAAANLPPATEGVPVQVDPPALVLTGWRWECVEWLAVVLGTAAWCTWMWTRDLGWFQTADGTLRGIAGMAAIGIVVGVLTHPVRWRHEFWMDARGVTRWRSDAYPRSNEWSRVAWNNVRDVQVHGRGKSMGLSVLSGDGFWGDSIGLRDRRGRPETAAFIQAVVREGERHPRVPLKEYRPLYPVPLLMPYDPAAPREGRR